MKQRGFKILMAVMAAGFLAGMAALLYPTVSSVWNSYRDSQLIAAYEAQVESAEDDGVDYSAEWEAAYAYNDELEPVILPDSFAQATTPWEDDEDYASVLNVLGNGMMGYISIPSIGVKVPIYHSTEDDVLAKGAGHLLGSSLPVGGEGSHAVISAHCGLPGKALFTDLDLLQVGDQFYIYVLDEVLAYEVDQIEVVEPTDTSLLVPVEGEDYVTLVTCTPYGVNSHRLLVRGHRVDYDPDAEASTTAVVSFKTNYLAWALSGLAITAALLWCVNRLLKRRRRKADRRAEGRANAAAAAAATRIDRGDNAPPPAGSGGRKRE